ncbi:MAG: LuxR C-terminal-related transcriptional regulator [Proteobacteria bacterium]|nr:LuxR C-terminal-related transcriptional regulator [Pseudomonadota bacterium]MBU1649616.1 LuxR C-terminal-related transcriptional regulator [Pseudomonadota bacterium]
MPTETTQTHQGQGPNPGKELIENTTPNCRPNRHKPQAAASVKVTPREQEILSMVAKGQTSKMMGEHLGLSIRTIERHRANLLKKFSQKNSIALIQTALRHGLL